MKRKTKQQRETEEKAALRRRVLDMAFGAFGSFSAGIDPDSTDHMGMFGSMDAESLGRWIGAVKANLIPENKEVECYLLQPHCLAKWDSLDAIVDALYGMGVRA